MKWYSILALLVLMVSPFVLSDAAAFNIQTDGFNYKFTGIVNNHKYAHDIINNNSTLLSGTWNIGPANNDQKMPLPFQNKIGEYTWNWYTDSSKTVLVDSISWGVLDLSASKKEVSSKVSITIETLLSEYKEGELVVIFGTVTPVEWATPLTIQLINQRNHLVGISQIIPQEDGSFSWSFLAEGYNWKHSQKISLRAYYLDELSSIDFDFIKNEKIKPVKDKFQNR